MTRLLWRRWEGRRPTGIDRVCLAYLDHYGRAAQAVVQHRLFRRILNVDASAALFRLLAAPERDFKRAVAVELLKSGLQPGRRGEGRFYFNIGHTGLNDPGLGEWVRKAGVRPIYFVHDLIPITHPEFCRAGEKPRHEVRMRTVLRSAAGVIGNSEATLRDLAAFGTAEGLPHPPQVAALLGSDAVSPRSAPHAGDGHPTFVVLGTIEARKNHIMLLHVWSRIVERLGPNAPRLLVIGQRGWESEQAVDLLERSVLLKSAVMEINHCDDVQLAGHLMAARALLFPSLVEGYGLPLVEAMRMGTPVVASDLPVFHEIAGDVPDYLDPLDGPAWEQAILSFMDTNSSQRAAQLSRQANYEIPTWKRHFEKVNSWLATL